MYEFTSSELDQLLSSIKECEGDVACLDAWLDSLEYDIKNILPKCAYGSFRGFISALQRHLSLMRGICFSKEFILDL